MLNYSTVHIKKGEARFLKSGGQWIYDNEIDRIDVAGYLGHPPLAASEYPKMLPAGSLVSVVDFNDFPLGVGYINLQSKIAVRMLSRNANESIDAAFFARRVKAALDYRFTLFADKFGVEHDCMRLIYGEADMLPGLTVDLFNDVVVISSTTAGMDVFKALIADEVRRYLSRIDGICLRGIYERSDSKQRDFEGISAVTGPVVGTGAPISDYKLCAQTSAHEQLDSVSAHEQLDPVSTHEQLDQLSAHERLEPVSEPGYLGDPFDTSVMILENGLHFHIDVKDGQKGGYFLDQKYNRLAIRPFCKSAKVLDLYTHVGSFALNAAVAGASSVVGVDSSATAVELARRNAEINSLSDVVTFVCADAEAYMRDQYESGARYGVVILDPPGFSKSQASLKKAAAAYRRINEAGLRLVSDDGYFVTASCSHFLNAAMFLEIVTRAAVAAHKRLRLVEYRGASPDHPVLPTLPMPGKTYIKAGEGKGEQPFDLQGFLEHESSAYLKFFVFQVME